MTVWSTNGFPNVDKYEISKISIIMLEIRIGYNIIYTFRRYYIEIRK
jgi:hypothetical protein